MTFYFLATWHVYNNPPKAKVFKLEKTARDYEKHLKGAFGGKLLYYNLKRISL